MLTLALLGGSAVGQPKYGPGVSDTEIKLGQTMPYSGPASAYGTIGKVEQAYFKKVNDEGGVNGRMIKLISLDDSYSPPKTVEQVRKLIEQEGVLALFQMLGTPGNSAILKYVNAQKVPHLFLSAGGAKFFDPKNFPWTMPYLLSYQVEGEIYGKYLLKSKPNAKIAILYQNDDYGKDVLKGVKDVLKGPLARMIVAEVSYEVTDPTVDSQIITLKDSGADILINISTPKAAAQAIRKVYDLGWRPLHLISTVGSSVGSVLKPAGLDRSVGLVTVRTYKDANEKQWKDDPSMLEWRAFMARYYREGDVNDSLNITGYNAAQLMVQILKQCGTDLTRENVMRQAANLKDVKLPLLVPGIAINTGPSDYAPVKQAQLARFDGTQWVTFGDVLGK